MPNRTTEPVRIHHADAYVHDLNPDDDGSYHVDITLSIDEDTDDGADNDEKDGENDDEKTVATRGTDLVVNHPVEDTEELRHRTHLTAQLAAHNQDQHEQATAATDFDDTVLTIADRALTNAGIDVHAAPVERDFLYAFLLHDAWGFESIPALTRHLDEYPAIAARINMSSPPSAATFYRREITLTDAGLRDALKDASERAVHAVARNCSSLPDPVKEYWGINLTPALADYPVSDATRRKAIRNWVSVLLADATETLTFDRAENTSYTLEEFIGLFAHSALQQVGIAAAPPSASWLYDADQLPTGHVLLKHITSDSLRIDEIEAQFADAHAAVLQRAATNGLFDEPLDLAFDTTTVTWWGRWHDATIGKYRPGTDATADWMYCLLTAITEDARVCFGVTLAKSKDLYDGLLDDLLTTASTYAQLDQFFADKEFYRGSIIEVLRKYVGDEWAIKAQRKDPIKEFISKTPKGKPNFKRDFDVTSASPPPNAVAIPNEDDDQQTLDQFLNSSDQVTPQGGNSSHTVYLTDTNGEDALDLIDDYNDRWSIETAVRQYKHDYLPVCASANTKVRVYCANMAVLFFNWHALINRTLSPQYNLPLTVTHQELLTAIRDVAFSDSSHGSE